MRYQFNAEEHVHMLDDLMLTGTSTVMKMLKPPLAYWASGHAVKVFGVTEPKLLTVIKNAGRKQPTDDQRIAIEALKNAVAVRFDEVKAMDDTTFLGTLIEAYNAHAVSFKESAEDGTDMHAELEDYVKFCMDGGGVPLETKNQHPAVQCFAKWAIEKVDRFLWSELHTYSHVHFLGGITDCGALMKDGNLAIIDFKSSKEAYPTHFMQIGGYDIELSEQGGYTADGQKVFDLPAERCPHCQAKGGTVPCVHCKGDGYRQMKISKHIVFPFGAENPVPAVSTRVEDHKQGFIYALGLYRTINKLENK